MTTKIFYDIPQQTKLQHFKVNLCHMYKRFIKQNYPPLWDNLFMAKYNCVKLCLNIWLSLVITKILSMKSLMLHVSSFRVLVCN